MLERGGVPFLPTCGCCLRPSATMRGTASAGTFRHAILHRQLEVFVRRVAPGGRATRPSGPTRANASGSERRVHGEARARIGRFAPTKALGVPDATGARSRVEAQLAVDRRGAITGCWPDMRSNGNTIRDKAAIAGIGQTKFSKGPGMSEYEMAVEAIFAACARTPASRRARSTVRPLRHEQTDDEQLLSVLGNPLLRFFAGHRVGRRRIGVGARGRGERDCVGNGGDRARVPLAHAASSRATEGSEAGRPLLGEARDVAARLEPVARAAGPRVGVPGDGDDLGRHRIEYGTTDDQYADVAIAFREHAMRNPNATRARR